MKLWHKNYAIGMGLPAGVGNRSDFVLRTYGGIRTGSFAIAPEYFYPAYT